MSGNTVLDRRIGGEERTRPAWLGDAIAVVAILIASGIILWDRLLADAWLSRTDLLTQYIPWYAFMGEQLRAFQLPGWNLHQFAGATFVGDPQSGWMYGPAMAFFTLLPPLAAMKAVVAFQLVFGALTMYAFIRVLGMGAAGGFMAAAVFAFGANVYQNTWCCTIWVQASTWIPLCLLGVELGLRRTIWSGRAVGWGMAGIGLSQILAGWLGQGAYNAFLLVAGYLAYRSLISPPDGRTPFAARARLFMLSGLAVFGFGIGLAAAGLLPRFDANQYSNLAGGLYGETGAEGSGWRWEAVVQRTLDASDTFFTRRYFVGGVAIALALAAPFVAGRRHAVPFFAVFTVVLLALVVRPFWLHRLFFLLPRYQDLHEHTPFRVWGLLMVGPAVLAGAAVDTLRGWATRRWAIVAAVLPLVVIQGVRVDIAERYRPVGRASLLGAVMVTSLLVAAAVIHWPALHRRWPGVQRAMSAVPILLIAAVLWEPTGRQLVEKEVNPTMPPLAQIDAMVPASVATTDLGGAGAFLREQRDRAGQPFRYFGYDGLGLRTEEFPEGVTYQRRVAEPEVNRLLVSGRPVRLGLEDIQGYNPIQTARYVALMRALNGGVAQDYHDANVLSVGLDSPILDLLNVRYVVVPAAVEPNRPDLLHLGQRLPEVFNNGDVRVLERPNPMPRAWIVHAARRIPDDAALAALAGGDVALGEVALLADPPPPLVEPRDPAADAVTVEREDENRLRLTATTDAAGLLVLSEIYDPGWRAYVDGERVDVLRANYTFRAVPIPAGTHAVELRYEPTSLRVGLAVSGVTALLLAVVFATAARRWLRRG